MNLYIRGVPEAGERDKGIRKVFEEILAENSNLKQEDLQAQETQSPKQGETKQTHIKTCHN